MTATDPQRDSVFVSAASLVEECASATPPVLLDIRFRHGQHDRRFAYLEAHLPGAIYVDLQNELAGRPGGVRGNRPLPEIAALQEAARKWGLRRDSRVVVYDDHTGLQAGRAWWVLRWAGLSSVRMLDGGIDAWNAAGLPVTSDVPQPISGNIELTAGHMPVFGPDQVGDFVRDGVLLDSRGNENYRGGPSTPGEARRGHIPGAVNAPTPENLMESGLLRSAAELRTRFDLFGATGEAPIGVYCGGGVSAAHQIAVLTSLGIPASLYPGSWSAWSADPTRPVARGIRPWGGDAAAERAEA
jgi:thiosulfate/3-mercaptopyruvate sulfurtransferase